VPSNHKDEEKKNRGHDAPDILVVSHARPHWRWLLLVGDFLSHYAVKGAAMVVHNENSKGLSA
jgi:hypothetical protein